MAARRAASDVSFKEMILQALKEKPREHMTTAEVAKATGLTRDQVTSALHQMRKSMDPYVRRIGDAVWLYNPEPRGSDPEGEVFEEAGKVDGRVVVRDQKGNLYTLEELLLRK